MKFIFQTLWTIPATLLLLAACAAPPPPDRPNVTTSDTAVIKGGRAESLYLFGKDYVTLTRIDETVLVDDNNNPLYRNIEITPGPHSVYFNYRHTALCITGTCAMSLSRDRKLALNAEAGHVYRVRTSYRDGRFSFWITDQSDGQRIIAGARPKGADWSANEQGFGSQVY